MELATAVVEFINHLMDCCASGPKDEYVDDLPGKTKRLRDQVSALRDLRDDFQKRVQRAREPTEQVKGWVQRVDSSIRRAETIIQDAQRVEELEGEGCCGSCCASGPSPYEVGRQIADAAEEIANLKQEHKDLRVAHSFHVKPPETPGGGMHVAGNEENGSSGENGNHKLVEPETLRKEKKTNDVANTSTPPPLPAKAASRKGDGFPRVDVSVLLSDEHTSLALTIGNRKEDGKPANITPAPSFRDTGSTPHPKASAPANTDGNIGEKAVQASTLLPYAEAASRKEKGEPKTYTGVSNRKEDGKPVAPPSFPSFPAMSGEQENVAVVYPGKKGDHDKTAVSSHEEKKKSNDVSDPSPSVGVVNHKEKEKSFKLSASSANMHMGVDQLASHRKISPAQTGNT